MKKSIKTLLLAVAVSGALFSCTSEEDIPSVGAVKHMQFTATSSDGAVVKSGASNGRMKTQLMNDNSVIFQSNDGISVFDGSANNHFTTTGSGYTVTFEGDAATVNNYTALYPYQSGATLSGTTLTAVLPVEQKAQTSATSYDPAAALSVATTTKEDMNLLFKNATAMVKVTTTEPLSKIVLYGNNKEKLSGKVTIAVSETPTSVATVDSVVLVPASGTSFPAGTYYMNVATGGSTETTLSKGMKLVCYAPDGYVFSRNISTAVTLKRSRIMNIGKLDWLSCAEDAGKINANGHAYVDMGVPAVDGQRALWGTMNVGATSVTGFGDYYAWGEITPKSDYYWNTYRFGERDNLTKYNATDGKTLLDLADDVAHVKWGGGWVMPKSEEFDALSGNTTHELTSIGSVNGCKFMSKSKTSQSIFLPAGGCREHEAFVEEDDTFRGDYWSASLTKTNCNVAYFIYFDTDEFIPTEMHWRYFGQQVRPVLRIPSFR